MDDRPFWEKPLAELNATEWERLCDGCGRCCLKKLQDEDSGEIRYTRVVCRYFNERNSRCGCYTSRRQLVPDCLEVREMDLDSIAWMPDTCAYRLRHDGRPLYDWHPLISGSRHAMEAAGIAIAGRVLSEELVHEDGLEEHIIRWVSP
ncbi:MAG: hypothetical protein RLZZ385_2249 [Pseudomonadota bacterium]|jgi:uncharacterized cysteine cluster protein YcgN (CxxCxxCC family)